MKQVKKFRLPPSIRGFNIEQLLDNTLYLVCVVTRGSSWRGSSGIDETDLRIQALTDSEEESYNDDVDYDIDALEMVGLLRTERDASEAVEVVADDGGLFMFPEWAGNATTMSPMEETTTIIYPSSNETNLLVLKPIVVNLGSKSSKCTELRTPVDPAKLRFIDDKRMSIIIGSIAGVIVFLFILASIIVNREKQDDDIIEDDSLASSHKSPSSKTNQSGSLNHIPPRNNTANLDRLSRNNSQSSSLLNNRMSLVEAAGPDGLPPRRNNTAGQPPSAPGTLRRNATLNRQKSSGDTPMVCL